ncbi:MAG TPA: SIMPL domain-containing protein [Candidatus Baltobacteraceae bacterium]|nr:SIMPL domain-containing protein [Candidatus Baltobacteraceae bacterium]
MKYAALVLGALALLGIERSPVPPWAQGGPLPDGVTVEGTSVVSAPASRVVLTMNVTARDRFSSIGTAELQPLIDALVQSGASRDDITLPPYLTDGTKLSSVPVTVTLHDPDAAAVARGAGIVAHFLFTTPTLWVATANVRTDASNCAALVRTAQQNAVAQARENAQRLATYAQAHLGEVAALDGTGASSNADTACVRDNPIWYPNGVMPLARYLNVELTNTVRIRYSAKLRTGI